ncbi:MAG: hypothetical protein FWD62_01625 [Betaproteobacteria bacterium]|nr:hypothetical protein [Betaproteobacteria bacterium]
MRPADVVTERAPQRKTAPAIDFDLSDTPDTTMVCCFVGGALRVAPLIAPPRAGRICNDLREAD